MPNFSIMQREYFDKLWVFMDIFNCFAVFKSQCYTKDRFVQNVHALTNYFILSAVLSVMPRCMSRVCWLIRHIWKVSCLQRMRLILFFGKHWLQQMLRYKYKSHNLSKVFLSGITLVQQQYSTTLNLMTLNGWAYSRRHCALWVERFCTYLHFLQVFRVILRNSLLETKREVI